LSRDRSINATYANGCTQHQYTQSGKHRHPWVYFCHPEWHFRNVDSFPQSDCRPAHYSASELPSPFASSQRRWIVYPSIPDVYPIQGQNVPQEPRVQRPNTSRYGDSAEQQPSVRRNHAGARHPKGRI